MAWVRSTPGLQPEMVPSSVEKMNAATPEAVPLDTVKPVPPLNTMPLGVEMVPAGEPAGAGTVTTSGVIAPAPLYSVDRPVPLSEIHHGPVALGIRPQALTRLGSVTAATPA